MVSSQGFAAQNSSRAACVQLFLKSAPDCCSSFAAYIVNTPTRDHVKHISIVVSCREGCRVRPVPSKVNIAGVVIIFVLAFHEPDPLPPALQR